MWQLLRISHDSDSSYRSEAEDLIRSTTQTLILTTSALYLAWHVAATSDRTGQWGWQVWLITSVFAVSSATAMLFLRKQLLIAQIIWLVGMAATVTLAVSILQAPDVAFLYALLPLAASVMIGWPAGLLAEVGVVALMGWLAWSGSIPVLFSARSMLILTAGVVAGVLGWASGSVLYTATQWSLYSMLKARRRMEEAQEHRAQLAQLTKSLDEAYYRLNRTNAALAAAWRVADESERFKAEFVANVSHEMRTPLNLIVGFSEMIATAPESYGSIPLPGPYRTDINAIYHSAQHLLALVDDVLDLARIEVGKIALVREGVDLAPVVIEATETVRDYIAAKGLALLVTIPPDLPIVHIDRLRIRQVLLNLLVNAARFTDHGSISVDLSQQDGEVKIQVADTGRGVLAQDLPKIFEEFRSTEQPFSAWHSGTGLGLPISKKFVELHGGQMGVDSVAARGTCFWFTLPSIPPAARDTPPLASSRPVLPVALPSSEAVVVVAHDDPHVAILLQRYLDGYQIEYAASIEQGLALTNQTKALALVHDGGVVPPDCTGNLLIVNCPLPSIRPAANALGAEDLLVKPVSLRELLAAIERIGRPVHRPLIVDDDPGLVRLFRRILATRIPVQDCLEAYNGAEALHIMRQERPDVVLLDLVMPEVDGRAVLEHMAADHMLAQIPVIVVSAKAQEYLNSRMCGSIQVSKGEGLLLGEVTQTLEAIFRTLAPGWRQPDSRAPRLATAPLASPASADTLSPPTPLPDPAR